MSNEKPKFTPGPWKAVMSGVVPIEGAPLYPAHVKRIHHDEQGRRMHSYIADLHSNIDADAHLIAAAPDLYAALEKLSTIAQCSCARINHAKGCYVRIASEALAKARGEEPGK